jgi:hypothetical protein
MYSIVIKNKEKFFFLLIINFFQSIHTGDNTDKLIEGAINHRKNIKNIFFINKVLCQKVPQKNQQEFFKNFTENLLKVLKGATSIPQEIKIIYFPEAPCTALEKLQKTISQVTDLTLNSREEAVSTTLESNLLKNILNEPGLLPVSAYLGYLVGDTISNYLYKKNSQVGLILFAPVPIAATAVLSKYMSSNEEIALFNIFSFLFTVGLKNVYTYYKYMENKINNLRKLSKKLENRIREGENRIAELNREAAELNRIRERESSTRDNSEASESEGEG